MNCFIFGEENSRQIHSSRHLTPTESSSAASGFFSFNSVSQSSASFSNSMSIDTAESRTALAAHFGEFERPNKLNLPAVSTELKLEIPRLPWRELTQHTEFSHWPNCNGSNVRNTSTLPNKEAENVRIPAYSTVTETREINPENRTIKLFDEHKHDCVRIEPDLSIAMKKKFTIREISPKWVYSTEVTKIIIVGTFLCEPSESAWACMFGDIEVPAEIIQTGVLGCEAPPHLPGKVTFCVTSGNRQSCSEIREFEYRNSCIHCNGFSKGYGKFLAIEDTDSLRNIMAGAPSAPRAAELLQSAIGSDAIRTWQRQREAAASANGKDDIQTVSAMPNLVFRNTRDYNSAALSIQKKYRGWKARRDFRAYLSSFVAHFPEI